MEINKISTTIEKKFNIAGSIPFVSIFSGQLRYVAGVVQMLAGAVFALIGTVGRYVAPKNQKWENLTRLSIEHMLHGPLNMARGLAEALIGATLILPVVLGLYQLPNDFKPMIPYEEEPILAPAAG